MARLSRFNSPLSHFIGGVLAALVATSCGDHGTTSDHQASVVRPHGNDTAVPVGPPRSIVAHFLGDWAVAEVGPLDPATAFPRRITRSRDGMAMVLIPAGTFFMGGIDGDRMAQKQERPRHKVTLTRAYYLDETEVTYGMWMTFVRASKTPVSWTPTGRTGHSLPIGGLAWEEVQPYLAWAGVELPTEAQWERAARGGVDGTVFPWGDEDDDTKRNGIDVEPDGIFDLERAVRTFEPNPYGLYDMIGNEAEWCSDWFGDYSPDDAVDPTGPATGAYQRVLRGNFIYLRTSNRDGASYRSKVAGFRCAKTLP